nr:YqgE/AlgH family protein [Tomitella biformata]
MPEDSEGFRPSSIQSVLPGSLLLAGTSMLEPIFRRTVIYVIENNDGGTLGVVINRPTETPIAVGLPQWADLCKPSDVFYLGGPVKLEGALCLGVLKPGVSIEGADGVSRVSGRVVMIDVDADPAPFAAALESARIFVGYAGWTFGQLDGELARDDWMVFTSRPGDVLADPGTDLWGAVLRRQPMPWAMLATHPIDVDRN